MLSIARIAGRVSPELRGITVPYRQHRRYGDLPARAARRTRRIPEADRLERDPRQDGPGRPSPGGGHQFRRPEVGRRRGEGGRP